MNKQSTLSPPKENIARIPRKFPMQFSLKLFLIVVGSLAIVVIGSLFISNPLSANKTVEKVEVISAPVQKSVSCLGRLEPHGEIVSVSAPASTKDNRIEKVLVAEGDKVKANQAIAVLSSQQKLEAALAQARASLRVAQAELEVERAGTKEGERRAQEAQIDKLEVEMQTKVAGQKAAIRRMEAQLENAKKDYNRFSMLFKEGAVSASDLDQKELNYKTTEQSVQEAQSLLRQHNQSYLRQIESAKATLHKLNEVRPVDLAVREAEVIKRRAAVLEASANLANAYVKSPISGTVIELNARSGEQVPEDGIAEIANTELMTVVAEVDETDVPSIVRGNSVEVTTSVFGDTVLNGEVVKIGHQVLRQNVVNTDPTSNTDARVVEVEIHLDKDSSKKVAKLSNLQVDCRILLGQKES